MWILFVILAAAIIPIIYGLVSGKSRTRRSSSDAASSFRSPAQPPNSIDAWNPPSYFSPEEKAEIKRMSDFCGHRYLTSADIRDFCIKDINALFQKMPGWSEWDATIHEYEGQYDRMDRAARIEKISVLCYDPRYKLAKVQGTSNIYLTSSERCSCPDFRKRRLPCKHMYGLAMELNGDVSKIIRDDLHKPLYGLSLALAGRLPKSKNGIGGIRNEIKDLGGKWSDTVEYFSSAVVVGSNASEGKKQRIIELGIEILSPEDVGNLFSKDSLGETDRLCGPQSKTIEEIIEKIRVLRRACDMHNYLLAEIEQGTLSIPDIDLEDLTKTVAAERMYGAMPDSYLNKLNRILKELYEQSVRMN